MLWSKLLVKLESELLEALEKAYKDSCLSQGKQFRYRNNVVMYKDGSIGMSYEGQNSTHGGVWHGVAIYVGGFEEFVPWENDVEKGWIEPLLDENEKRHFANVLAFKYGDDAEDYYTFSELQEWDEEVYDRVVAESIASDVEAYARDKAREEYDRVLEHHQQTDDDMLKMQARNLLEGIKNLQQQLGWTLWRCGAYTLGDIHFYASYHGKGLDANVHDGAYGVLVNFTDLFFEHENGEYDLNTTVDMIVERIKDRL